MMDFLPPPVFLAQTCSSSHTLEDGSIAPRECEDISSCALDLVNTLRNLSLNLASGRANPSVLNQVDWVQSG
jgi:hypothetical protein